MTDEISVEAERAEGNGGVCGEWGGVTQNGWWMGQLDGLGGELRAQSDLPVAWPLHFN